MTSREVRGAGAGLEPRPPIVILACAFWHENVLVVTQFESHESPNVVVDHFESPSEAPRSQAKGRGKKSLK